MNTWYAIGWIDFRLHLSVMCVVSCEMRISIQPNMHCTIMNYNEFLRKKKYPRWTTFTCTKHYATCLEGDICHFCRHFQLVIMLSVLVTFETILELLFNWFRNIMGHLVSIDWSGSLERCDNSQVTRHNRWHEQACVMSFNFISVMHVHSLAPRSMPSFSIEFMVSFTSSMAWNISKWQWVDNKSSCSTRRSIVQSVEYAPSQHHTPYQM